MMPYYVALTTLTSHVRMEELAAVAAALQTQVNRDFGSVWDTGATIAAVSFESIPAGYIPLIVQDTLDADGVNGYHRTRGDDTPYIVVPHGPTWPLAASHELLRMIANPTGSGRVPALSHMPGQAVVEYLLDVCAPCQDIAAAYAIDGVPVSDFVTRSFFGNPGQRFSFTGAVRTAFAPSANGVVTWLADDGLLYQARADHQSRIRVHGGFSSANRARLLFRELVDLLTPDRLVRLSNARRSADLVDAEQNARRVRLANLTRFGDDIAWRFGRASAVAPEQERRPDGRRLKAYASGSAKSEQQPSGENVVRALRTVS